MSVSQGLTEASLGLLSWPALLVHSIVSLSESQLVLQSSSLGSLSHSSPFSCSLCFRLVLRLLGWKRDRRVWRQSGTCSFQSPMDGMGELEQPSSRKLTCRLAREAEAARQETCNFAPSMEGLENGMTCRVGCQPPFGPLSVAAGSVFPILLFSIHSFLSLLTYPFSFH